MAAPIVTHDIWPAVRAELGKILARDLFENWIAPLQATCDGEELVIQAPTEFGAIWVEENYLDLIREKVAALNPGLEVSLASPDAPEPAGAAPAVALPSRGTLRDDRFRDVRHSSTARKNKVFLNPRNTFENFIVGSSNQLAHAAATAVAAEPGKSYNPLFFYGESGLGKTHLMHAIAHAIQSADPEAHVVYVSCEKFTNKFLKAIRENTMDEFRRLYRKVDVLLIDDIQFLEGKERTQEEFFYTFNELFESQRQICLTSDRPASEISRLEGRLVSRFQWGMVTDIQAPDLETRAAILRKKAIAMGYPNLPDNIIDFLAARITRNVRRMEGALIKVATYQKLVKQPLDLAQTERLIHDILQEEAHNQITLEKIQKKVVEYFDLRMSDMVSKRRPAHIAFPRQVAMYLCRILTHHPLKEIGEAFGGRDHGTVIHACKAVENAMEQDESIKRNVEYLTKQLTGQML